jgi:arabinan endo-1,5-alpha-L-arabinosidase
VSTFGSNQSDIGLITNKTLDPKSPNYHWVDQGKVFGSVKSDDFNAIDPNLAIDADGGQWLSFGSFWSGIKMRRIDPETGKLLAQDSTLYSLASRPRTATQKGEIEAPFVIRHGGYYYLFVSFDRCCRGAQSTYRTMVGRSDKITGPYVDKDGNPMMEGGATELLAGNERWKGPGGESVVQDKDRDLLVFHTYDGKDGRSFLQISTLVWENGWPRAGLLPTAP